MGGLTPRPLPLQGRGGRGAAHALGLATNLAALACSAALAQAPMGDLAGMASLADLGRLENGRTHQASGYRAVSESGDPLGKPEQDEQGR